MGFCPFPSCLEGPSHRLVIWKNLVFWSWKDQKKTSDSWFGMIYIFRIPPSSFKNLGCTTPTRSIQNGDPRMKVWLDLIPQAPWGISIPRDLLNPITETGFMVSWKLNTHVEEVTPQSSSENMTACLGHFVTSKNQGTPPICSEESHPCQGKVVTWGNPFSGGDSSAVQELFLTCKLMPMIRQDGSHLPSWELTYALKSPFWRWLSFSPGGIC